MDKQSMKFELKPEDSIENNEKSLILQEKLFGVKPEYLSDGLDSWLSASDEQAEGGIAELQKQQRFEIFRDGMASYDHQVPKDVGAVSFQLERLDKLPTNGLLMKREYKEGGTMIRPEFEKLFAGVSDADLKKAGYSFYAGRILHENLQTIARLGIDSATINVDILLGWRSEDYNVHRRKLNEREFELLLSSLDALDTSRNFYNEHRDEYFDGTISEEDKAEKGRLTKLAKSAVETWWSYYVSMSEGVQGGDEIKKDVV